MTTKQFTEMSREQAERFMSKPEVQPVRARLAEMVGDHYVVDIGCGKGDEVSTLFTPKQYFGIDCSAELVRIARRNNPKHKFAHMTALDLPQRYWFTIIKAVFEHLPPDEAKAIYDHVRSICDVMLVAWHTEPGKKQLTLYHGELGTMMQNRHDRNLFSGVKEREVCGKHVVWTVI